MSEKGVRKKRPLQDLEILENRILEILDENGIWVHCHSTEERKDGIIKVTLTIYPEKVLREKGMIIYAQTREESEKGGEG